MRVYAWNCYTIYTLTTKDLQTGHIEWKEHSSGSRWAEQTHTVLDVELEWERRRRSQANEPSTDPKQKTQPDGDEEFCQYGLCCDTYRLLRWGDRKKTRFFKERWKKKDREGWQTKLIGVKMSS